MRSNLKYFNPNQRLEQSKSQETKLMVLVRKVNVRMKSNLKYFSPNKTLKRSREAKIKISIIMDLKGKLRMRSKIKFGNSIVGQILYHISGIFLVRNFWRKCRLEGVLNHRVLFSLFQGQSMKTYSRLIFCSVFFGNFREVANSVKIKPTRKTPDIRYL